MAGVLAVKWLPKIGGWTGYIGGLWVNVLSTFMIGLGGFTGAGIGYYSCWFAVVVMVPIHETLNYNGYTMITACRVSAEQQTKCQGNNWIAGNLGWLIGSSFWGRHVFDGTATGLAAAWPIHLACLLYTFSGALALWVGYTEGWKIGCGKFKSVDERDKFLHLYNKPDKSPPPTPTWCVIAFGALFGAVMFGTPGDIAGVLAPLFGLADRDYDPQHRQFGRSASWAADCVFYAGCTVGACVGIWYMLSHDADAALRESLVGPSVVHQRGSVIAEYNPTHETAMAARKGEAVAVIQDDNDDWVKVKKIEGGEEGFIPRSFVNFEAQAGGGGLESGLMT